MYVYDKKIINSRFYDTPDKKVREYDVYLAFMVRGSINTL